MSESPETIWGSKSTTGNCVVSFNTPSEEYCIEYRRADLPATDAQALANEKVQALVEALKLAEEYWQIGAVKAPLGMIQNVVRTRRAALAALEGKG